jgi:hypothetical protein
MLSEGSPFIKRPSKPPPIDPSPDKTPKSTIHAEKPNPSPRAQGSGVDYTPPKTSIKEFYKTRLEAALLGESKAQVKLGRGAAHEQSALWGASREALGDALSGFAKGAAVGGLASVLGIAASDSVFPHPDVATHNAQVAAGEVVPPKGVSIGRVRGTAEPLPDYRAFQRAAMAAQAAQAKGEKGK